MNKQPTSNDEPWYGAQMVFRNKRAGKQAQYSYEERFVLIRAESETKAFAKAEDEAKEYCKGLDSEYLGFVRLFHIFEEKIDDKSEVFSIMRDSDLESDAYLDRFYDTGIE